MSGSERCAPAAERRGDQLHGTAAPARFFVLVEQPGAWGRNAVDDWRRDHPSRTALLARTHTAGGRLLLVRRLHREPGEPRRWALVDARPGSETSRWGTFDDDGDLDRLDPREPVGEPSDEPVRARLHARPPRRLLRPARLAGRRRADRGVPGLGLAVLPRGRRSLRRERRDPARGPVLRPADGVERASRSCAPPRRPGHGRVLLRGRSCFVPAVQAAQHYAREALGIDAIDTLGPLEVDRRGDGVVAVRLAGTTSRCASSSPRASRRRSSGSRAARRRRRASAPGRSSSSRPASAARSQVAPKCLVLDTGFRKSLRGCAACVVTLLTSPTTSSGLRTTDPGHRPSRAAPTLRGRICDVPSRKGGRDEASFDALRRQRGRGVGPRRLAGSCGGRNRR